MSQLLLTVPAQSTINDPRVERDSTRLRQWLDSLPFANLDVVVPTINESLVALNRQTLPLQTRINLLELYTGSVQPLLDTISTPSGGNRNTDRQRQASVQFQNLVKELSYGYKIVINDGINQMQHRKTAALMVLAVFRAISHLTLGVLHAYKVYEPSPPQSWREIRQLYNWAQHNKVVTHPLKIKTAYQSESTIDMVFKQATMLSLSNPYHLPQDEIVQIHLFLDYLGNIADIVSPAEAPGGPGQFLIDLDSDAPPVAYDDNQSDLDQTRYRVVLTNRLVDNVQDIYNEYSLDESATIGFQPYSTRTRNLSYFERIQAMWWQKARRVHDREETMGWLGVTCGLLATHHFLNNGITKTEAPQETDTDEDIEISSLLTSGAISRPMAYRTKQCRLINQSNGGISIGMRRPVEANFRIGQVLGLHSGNGSNPQDWFLGVIRWFSQIREDEIKVGIQQIPGTIEVSDVEAVGESTNLIGKQQAILLKTPDQGPRNCMVLAGHGAYGRDRELLVTIDELTRQVHADQLIESTGSFDLFTAKIH